MRLDDYVWLEPDVLDRMVKELNKHNDAVYLFADYCLTDYEGNVSRHVSAVENFPEYDPAAASPHGASTLISVQKMRMAELYDKSIQRRDGVDLYDKLHKKGKVIHLPFRAFNYRQHEWNLIKNPINFY